MSVSEVSDTSSIDSDTSGYFNSVFLDGDEMTAPVADRLENCSLEQICWGSLWLLARPLAWFVEAIQWIMFQFKSDEQILYALKQEIQGYVQSEERKEISELQEIVNRYSEKANFPSRHLTMLNKILLIREFQPHIREILSGACVTIEDCDGITNIGSLKKKWPVFNDQHVYPRHSSHKSLPKCTWGITDRVINQVLIWVDPDKKLRMQLEKSAVGLSVIESILHVVNDWLKYKMYHKQIGPFGVSIYRDTSPLSFSVLN